MRLPSKDKDFFFSVVKFLCFPKLQNSLLHHTHLTKLQSLGDKG